MSTNAQGEALSSVADDVWRWLIATHPAYAVRAGLVPERIPSFSEDDINRLGAEAAALLTRVRAAVRQPEDADVHAILSHYLASRARFPDEVHLHNLVAPYTLQLHLSIVADAVIAPLPVRSRAEADIRRHLTADLVEMFRSLAVRIREQRARGIASPAPAREAIVGTLQRLRRDLPVRLRPPRSISGIDILLMDALPRAIGLLIEEHELAADVASSEVGLARLPGGEALYRELVERETTLNFAPEELHQLGLQQCQELAEKMTEVRRRLGGPVAEGEARHWVRAQPHAYARSPKELTRRYGAILDRIDNSAVRAMFHARATPPFEIRRLHEAGETAMSYGYYQPPSSRRRAGIYYFNASRLDQRLQLKAVTLMMHELLPGHHFHFTRIAADRALHPVQRNILTNAFSEGWAEYAAGLGWEAGLYEDDWDAYGRLSNERYFASRLVVDTALNLGRWSLPEARTFMQRNTLESDAEIATETLRYATDMPAQALAYRAGFLAFCDARASVDDLDLRDVHELMLGGGAVPLTYMKQRVIDLASRPRAPRSQ